MAAFKFYKITSTQQVADFLASKIKKQIENNKQVTWLVTGGSAIDVATLTSLALQDSDLSKLSVSLTDERYVPVDHPDSNWKQLVDRGFSLPKADLFPVLSSKSVDETTKDYAQILKNVLNDSTHKIGLFGMGLDGHVAALFPGSSQLHEKTKYATFFNNSPKPPPVRMTLTIPAIMRLDEAILYACGEEKRSILEKLKNDIPIEEQPSQILKNLQKLTIFNDQIGENL